MGFIRKKTFKFTDKKRSKRGVGSAVLMVLSYGLLIAAVYLSYTKRGEGGIEVGALGFGTLVASTAGLALGLYSFKEEEVYLNWPWIGTVGNALIWLFILGVILVGI